MAIATVHDVCDSMKTTWEAFQTALSALADSLAEKYPDWQTETPHVKQIVANLIAMADAQYSAWATLHDKT